MDKPNHRLNWTIAGLCVAVAAGASALLQIPHARAGEAAPPAAQQQTHDLAGRWQGRSYEFSRRKKECGEDGCQLTLDISACGDGWCGVEVADAGESKETCRATALKLDGGKSEDGDSFVFRGKLELAEGAEPYTVVASIVSPDEAEPSTSLSVTGDTGGEFRMFRREFPFETTLVRSGEAHCKPDKTASTNASRVAALAR